jgi:cytochrome c5
MRHFLGHIASYTIAVMLILGAALFAWVRSTQMVFSNEQTTMERHAPTPEHEFEWGEVGEHSYASNCMNCHGREGQGWDQYPGLEHMWNLFTAPGGRDFLVDVHLYGLTSRRWRAPMPSMGHMQDVELAAVLNHTLTHFGNQAHLPADAALYLPHDIAARRNQALSPAQVNWTRPKVDE